jgi:hypothetical protein
MSGQVDDVADEHIVVRVGPDGSVQAETKGIKGPRCLDSIELLEDLLEARTISSAFTPEYVEQTTQDTAHAEIEVDDELRRH